MGIPINKISNELKTTFLGTANPPSNIIWFLTERCNCRCTHCFVTTKTRELRPELSTQEIENFIIKNKQYLSHINITGGEPMVREDIETLLDIFHQHNIALSISTNGFLHEKLVSKIKSYYPENIAIDNFFLQTSLDGPRDIHNKIRQNEKAFDNAIGLIESAKKSRYSYYSSYDNR